MDNLLDTEIDIYVGAGHEVEIVCPKCKILDETIWEYNYQAFTLRYLAAKIQEHLTRYHQ